MNLTFNTFFLLYCVETIFWLISCEWSLLLHTWKTATKWQTPSITSHPETTIRSLNWMFEITATLIRKGYYVTTTICTISAMSVWMMREPNVVMLTFYSRFFLNSSPKCDAYFSLQLSASKFAPCSSKLFYFHFISSESG